MQTVKPQNNRRAGSNSNNYTPAIAPLSIHIPMFGKKKIQPSEAPQDKPAEKTKIKPTVIGKYELSDGKVTFFGSIGTFKKQWVIRAEIPLTEINSVESSGNLITILWNNVAYEYVHTVKTESFTKLQEQISAYLTEERLNKENNQKIASLKAELASAIKISLPTIDTCFDVLIALNQKRINWTKIETPAQKLEANINVSGKTFTPLNVDLTKIPTSVKSKVPKDIAKNAMDALKTIYAYFGALKPQDDLVENIANVDTTKTALSAYYTINDILLAQVTGQKVEDKEFSALDSYLVALADKSVIKLSFDELKAALANVDADGQGVNDVRAMFQGQIKNWN